LPNSFESAWSSKNGAWFSRIALNFVGPPKKSTADVAREKEIREFAKANGWIAEIHDPGLGVVFRKVTA